MVCCDPLKGFSIINEAEVDFFSNSFVFSMIQQILAIWSLVPLPFLNPACASGSSQFMCCWSLAWRFLNITLLVQLYGSPTTAHQVSLSITNSQSPPKPMSIESVMPSNHLILCHPLLLLPSIFPSIRVFSSESALCIRWPKYWSLSFNITPSNEHPGLISFRMDRLDLLAVQGTLKSLLQHHSSKPSMLLNFYRKKGI